MTLHLPSLLLGALGAYGVPAGLIGWLVLIDYVSTKRDRQRAARRTDAVPFRDAERHREAAAISPSGREILDQMWKERPLA